MFPTSHERRSGEPWDAYYRNGSAPWDIGGPQPAVTRLAAKAGFTGPLLDVGFGTGDNALHVASLGVSVLGVELAETAVAIARAKAEERGIAAQFVNGSAFELERLRRTFRTVLDCGLFHSLDDEERLRYVASLGQARMEPSTFSASATRVPISVRIRLAGKNCRKRSIRVADGASTSSSRKESRREFTTTALPRGLQR